MRARRGRGRPPRERPRRSRATSSPGPLRASGRRSASLHRANPRGGCGQSPPVWIRPSTGLSSARWRDPQDRWRRSGRSRRREPIAPAEAVELRLASDAAVPIASACRARADRARAGDASLVADARGARDRDRSRGARARNLGGRRGDSRRGAAATAGGVDRVTGGAHRLDGRAISAARLRQPHRARRGGGRARPS